MTQVMQKETREQALKQFLAANGWGAATIRPLAGDASFRHYDRLFMGERRAVLMDAPPEKEDVRPFLHVAQWLRGERLSAPEVLAADPEQGFLLLEDLGDALYSAELASDRAEEAELYVAAIRALRLLQQQAAPTLASYDKPTYLREVALFSEWYLPQLLDGSALKDAQASYLAVWEALLKALPPVPTGVVLRDYHADNLIWLPERDGVQRVGMLDFQDALIGPVTYDLVSLLEDARRDVSAATLQRAVAAFLQDYPADVQDFRASYALMGAQRNCKIIGIFHRLHRRDNKPHYLKFLPRVWGHLANDVAHPALEPLRHWLAAYAAQLPEWREVA